MNKIKKCKVCGRESKYELCNSCRGKERRENINTINAFIVVEKEFIQKDYVIDIGSN